MIKFNDGARNYYEPDILILPPEKMAEYRLEKLRGLLDFAYKNCGFHQERLRAAGFEPGGLSNIGEFSQLPVMNKNDARAFNETLNTIPQGKVREVFTTSGTTGAPVVYRYGGKDLECLAEQAGHMIGIAGVEPGDLFQITMPLGASMWIAGLNFWLAFQRRGAGTVRFGSGNSEGQLETIRNLDVTGLFLTAGFAVRLGALAEEKGLMDKLPVRKLLVVNENIMSKDLGYNDVGRRIESLWKNAEVRAVYGNTELGFSGAECGARRGFHTHGGAHYFEVLDPDTGIPVQDGQPGRLVVTSLMYRGLPLIRYAIDDITFIMRDQCDCGMTSDRMGPILGRLDDMIKVKGGVSIYPPAVDNLLLSVPDVEDYYVEAFTDEMNVQNIRICFAPRAGFHDGDAVKKLREAFREKHMFVPEVKIVSSSEIAGRINVPGKRKPQRFHDLRNGNAR